MVWYDTIDTIYYGMYGMIRYSTGCIVLYVSYRMYDMMYHTICTIHIMVSYIWYGTIPRDEIPTIP